MVLHLDDHHLRGPLKYYEGRFTWGQTLYFFADVHISKVRCPPEARVVHLSTFFQKICRWNPDKTFHLLLEIPGHMDITIAPQKRQLFISQMYQQVYKKREPNLVAHGIDIRYPGIKRALTILKKSSTIMKHIVLDREVIPAEKTKLMQMFPQLLRYFEDIDVGAYLRLFIQKGKLTLQPRFVAWLPWVETFFKDSLYRYELEPAVMDILRTVLTTTPDEKLPSKQILDVFLHKMQMIGVWLTDLATLLRILSIPEGDEIIVFAGADHIHNLIHVFTHFYLPSFFITEEVGPENPNDFQCLPVREMMKPLRPLEK